ncbi:hypothetical protein [Thermopirellula anaerolimosa]
MRLANTGLWTPLPDDDDPGDDPADGVHDHRTSVLTIIPSVDIDTDSDNTGVIDRSDGEEEIENKAGYSGTWVVWNSDDDNENGIADYLENAEYAYPPGMNWQPFTDDDLVPIVLDRGFEDLSGMDGFVFELKVTLGDGLSYWLDAEKTPITADEYETITEAGKQKGVYRWFVSGEAVSYPPMIYVEGIEPDVQTDTLMWRLFKPIPSDPPGGDPTYEVAEVDVVKMTNPAVDIDIDSDNTADFAGPDRSAQEEYLEAHPYGLGKVIVPNWGDADGDGVLDCWDGYWVGTSYFQDDANASANFVPLVVEIPEWIDPTTAKLSLDYNMAMTIPSGDPSQRPDGDAKLRVWTKDGNVRRNGSTVTDDPVTSGDFVMAGMVYSALALGFSENVHSITLYVEGVTENVDTKTLEHVRENGKPITSIVLNVYPTGNVAEGPVMSDRANYLVANTDSFFHYLLKNEDLRLALASEGIYDRDDLPQYCLEPLNREELIGTGIGQSEIAFKEVKMKVDVNDLVRDNPATGFAAGVYHDYISGKNIVAFQGTDATSFTDWYNNFRQALGHSSEQYDTAMQIGLDVGQHARVRSGEELITPTLPSGWAFTGHSLGGGLASASCLVADEFDNNRQGTPFLAATFNAAGLHVNTLGRVPLDIPESEMHQRSQGLITAYVVDWDILNNLQDAGNITIDILVNVPTAVGARVTLDSPLDLEMALGTFQVIFGVVTLIAGGAGGTTTIAGVYQILDTMVEAHGIYVECLYAHIANQ